MRTGGYAAVVLEGMGPEAAATVLEAVSLARRHGHRLVTPLHVASSILSCSSSTQAAGGLLRLSGQPLRHEDLKVSLDEALSRLPVACPVGADQLDLSNALVTLLRRAQTIQRQRDVGRRRRRQVAAVKLELKHLVASILDDPSVHRAMRKAGSGSRVKPNVLEHSNQQSSGGTFNEEVLVIDRPDATDLTGHSWDPASQEKRREGVTTERASLPSWLHRHQDAILTCSRTFLRPTCQKQKFAELSANNLKIMCEALELHVPQHQNIIPDIATTVLLRRSGLSRKARSSTSSVTWLLFQGNDFYGKKAMAKELSKLVFGAYTKFSLVHSVDSYSDTGNLAVKRKRSQHNEKIDLMTTLFEEILENPHRVVFIDGINQLDHESESGIKNLIATGRIMGSNVRDVNLEDTIFVLSSDEPSSSRASTSFPLVNRAVIDTQDLKEDTAKEKGVESRPFSLDLNACGEDVEDKTVSNDVGIMGVVDGVFHFD